MSRPALIVIDVQNDYFPGGAFPLAGIEAALTATETAIRAAGARGIPVFKVQHVGTGASPFFKPDTDGVKLHARIEAAAPDAPTVVKAFPDAFQDTSLQAQLKALDVDELLLCGMMTQHCITYTALSPHAADYRRVTVLKDATATVNDGVHGLALSGLSSRVAVAAVTDALG